MTGAEDVPELDGPSRASRRDSDLIAWRGAARRVGRLGGACIGAGALVYTIAAFASGQFSGRPVALGLGVATGALLVGAMVMVARAAVRGMLAAGRRGERLAGDDVGLTPPQARRRRAKSTDREASGGPP